MFAQGKVTTDHKVIRKWAKARKGWPAMIQRVTSAGVEIALSIVLPGCETGEVVRKLTWNEFFERFDQLKLTFIYQEKNMLYALI